MFRILARVFVFVAWTFGGLMSGTILADDEPAPLEECPEVPKPIQYCQCERDEDNNWAVYWYRVYPDVAPVRSKVDVFRNRHITESDCHAFMFNAIGSELRERGVCAL